MAFIPKRTAYLIFALIALIALIAYFRFRPASSPTPQTLTPTASPASTSPIPIPTLIVTPASTSASLVLPNPTPMPKNPKTGWLMYQNSVHHFSLEFPAVWQLKDYPGTTPMLALTNQVNQLPLGFTISDPSWGSEADLKGATPSGSFNYLGWQGYRYNLVEQGNSLTLVTATKSAVSGRAYRINWVYPSVAGAIDQYLKPILTTLKLTLPTATISAQPVPRE